MSNTAKQLRDVKVAHYFDSHDNSSLPESAGRPRPGAGVQLRR